jgi:hypothetical protein
VGLYLLLKEDSRTNKARHHADILDAVVEEYHLEVAMCLNNYTSNQAAGIGLSTLVVVVTVLGSAAVLLLRLLLHMLRHLMHAALEHPFAWEVVYRMTALEAYPDQSY